MTHLVIVVKSLTLST